jgi:pimeloyl-ACP methyl ester carboxylesterase
MHLPGITSRFVATPRLQIHLLEAGEAEGIPVLFIHGNGAAATFWEEAMLALPPGYRAIAPDMRGYGLTEDLPIRAQYGFDDWTDDLLGLLAALNIGRYHLVGHSLGGLFGFHLMATESENLLSLVLIAPGSPYGFGGTRNAEGEMIYSDGACSGAGLANPSFVRLLKKQYRRADNMFSPLAVMRRMYWHPDFRPAREQALLTALLQMKLGPKRYPGDSRYSFNWPGSAPGIWGPVNMSSPLYLRKDVEALLKLTHMPPILWLRGSEDLIVSDQSYSDVANLGRMGMVPGYPGERRVPPQPMLQQTRLFLHRYQLSGGSYQERVWDGVGHSPFLERPEAFRWLMKEWLGEGG